MGTISHLEVGRIRMGKVIPFQNRYRITFAPANHRPALQIFTDPQMKSEVWKMGRDEDDATTKCYLDGDVPRGWIRISWRKA